MKALELRYKYDAINGKETIMFVHTSVEHDLGEELLTRVSPTTMNMTVIVREDNVTEDGFNLVTELLAAGQRRLAKESFSTKVTFAIKLATQIGKLTPEEQNQAYKYHTNQINARRDARLDAAARQAIRCLMAM